MQVLRFVLGVHTAQLLAPPPPPRPGVARPATPPRTSAQTHTCASNRHLRCTCDSPPHREELHLAYKPQSQVPRETCLGHSPHPSRPTRRPNALESAAYHPHPGHTAILQGARRTWVVSSRREYRASEKPARCRGQTLRCRLLSLTGTSSSSCGSVSKRRDRTLLISPPGPAGMTTTTTTITMSTPPPHMAHTNTTHTCFLLH